MSHFSHWWAVVGAGLAFGAGAVPVLYVDTISRTLQSALLGYAAGVMTGAALLSLLPTAVRQSGLRQSLAGFLAGAAVLATLSLLRFGRTDKSRRDTRQTAIIILGSIVLHNIPEGLTVGIGYASGQKHLGQTLALAIGIQNIPEGFLAASALMKDGMSRLQALVFSAVAGMAEPIAALVGAILTGRLSNILGFLLSFAAGSMLYAVSETFIPDSHRRGSKGSGTISFLLGIITLTIIRYAFT